MRDIHEFDAATGGSAPIALPRNDNDARILRCNAVRHSDFRSHETVVMEGDPARFVYEVVEGAVMLYKLLHDGRRQVVELLGPGDVFGFSADDCHDCSAEVLVKTRLAVVSRDTAERDGALQARLMRRCWTQMQALHDHAILLGRKSAMERVASFIETLALNADTNRVHLAMTRQEIADYLGLTIETVSRSFSELKRRGHIVCERQDTIRIPDLDRISMLTGA